ncbi:hypothetical protein [Amycolatopsis nigrescens]|uniref:hypothetical protein n=1 Tax=Amycolatopsis nigrescens TaxID=381445 RepID=UPI00047795E3|nr:hypothetical protein [Amycolatopsis nigrescens]
MSTSPADLTDAARARLVMAYEACELAELARAAVPVGAAEPGTVLADAAHVLVAAQRFFEAAAVFERLAGAGWQLIGDTTGVPAQTARNRFAAAEIRLREELSGHRTPRHAGDDSWCRAHAIREPAEAALDLDDWVRRHEDGENLGATPVSDGLSKIDDPG